MALQEPDFTIAYKENKGPMHHPCFIAFYKVTTATNIMLSSQGWWSVLLSDGLEGI
jgi:hypothetical protein